jgi:hypothetical protein
VVEMERAKGKLIFFEEQENKYYDTDIYYEETVEDFSDNDEISSAEEGFMFGYLAA